MASDLDKCLILHEMVSDIEKSKCKRKSRYKSENEAKQSIKRVQAKHGASRSLRVYRCPVCFSFHITSSPRR